MIRCNQVIVSRRAYLGFSGSPTVRRSAHTCTLFWRYFPKASYQLVACHAYSPWAAMLLLQHGTSAGGTVRETREYKSYSNPAVCHGRANKAIANYFKLNYQSATCYTNGTSILIYSVCGNTRGWRLATTSKSRSQVTACGRSIDDVDFNATSTNPIKCQCNDTNLTMMVDRHFLCTWRIGHHGISRLTSTAAPKTSAGLQVRGYLYFQVQLLASQYILHIASYSYCIAIYMHVCLHAVNLRSYVAIYYYYFADWRQLLQ